MDYSKQKVTELRDECRNRGLDTSGLKAELVARLEQDDQSKGGAAAAPAAAAPAAKGRSQRGAGKGKAEAEPEPEPEAAPPSKKRTISQAIAELKDEGVKKKKTMVKKLDPNCPVAGEVFEDYDCMLNQTNIGQNNNKFYVIQVVKTPGEKYYCYTRWGRVGERGQDANKGPTTKDAAIKEFVSKFKDKTSNQWDNRDSFDPKPGKYTLIEIDHEAEEDQAAKVAALAGDKPPTITKLTVKPSALAPTTQNLMSLIFDTDMFKSAMASFDIDVKKMPLGAISKSQIAKGYEVLLEIEKELKNKASGSVINALSSKFYTLIPHSFGRMVPPPIKDQEMVQKKMDMLNVLGDIEIAQSLQDKINKGKSTTVSDEVDNPLDKNYATLKCDLTPVLPGQEMYEIINTYVKETKGRNVQLIDAFEVNRHGEDKRFDEHKDIKHRKLLWHGTNVAVVAAILSSGLRIMPHSGGRVGKGIYLASENGKSAGYVGCAGNIGIMFLAEATLGKEHSITMDDSSLTRAPPGFDSIVARGRTEPDPAKDIVIKIDGKDVIVPQGKPIPRAEYKNSNFSQSEYLLYKESQVRLRYVLKLKFG